MGLRRSSYIGRAQSCWKELAISVVEQALKDYVKLIKLGYIRDRNPTRKEIIKNRGIFETYVHRVDVYDLCDFVWGENMGFFIEFSHMEVDAEALRRGLDAKEREFRHAS